MEHAINKNAEQLIARMTEVEKIGIRATTNEAQVEHLRQTAFRSDGISEIEMKKVKPLIDAAYTVAGNNAAFGLTWKF